MSSNLREITKDLQRECGIDPDEVDGVPGIVTISAALAIIRANRMDHSEEETGPATSSAGMTFDDRTEGVLATLDPKAVPMFRRFLCLAKATAATMGCDYRLINGNRTWEEQDALYAHGRTKPGDIVTKAKGGQSNHNFRIAADAGVFIGKIYADDGTAEQKAKAAKVHKACSEHAEACGLEWGGSWTSIVDLPHFQIATGKTTAQLRDLFAKKGSVL